MTEHPYIVVLAGGEGTRLVSLTRALYGTDLPVKTGAKWSRRHAGGYGDHVACRGRRRGCAASTSQGDVR